MPAFFNLPSSAALLIGLTGGIGCGKSTVADLFEKKGAVIVDADVIAHQLTVAGGAAMAPIKAEFGDGFVAQDGSLNRQQMRALVFRDGTAKLRLEAILHPAIRDEVSRQINLHSLQNQVPDCAEPKIVEKNPGMSPKLQQPTYVLLVAPLLFESLSYRNAVARTLVIDCPQHTQLMRVMQRPGMVADEVLRIMAAQIPRAIRLQLADDVLFNDKQTSDLDIPVDNLHRRFVGLANFRGAQYRSRAHVLSPTSNTNDITR